MRDERRPNDHDEREVPKNSNKNPYKAMALMSAISAQLVGSILVGIFLGKWIDAKLGTLPLFLLVGLFVGLATGIYSMLRLIKTFSGDKEPPKS